MMGKIVCILPTK